MPFGGQQIGVGILIGSLLGYIFSEILPIEYELWRTRSRKSDREIDDWYKKAINDTNELILSCVRLRRLLNDNSSTRSEIVGSEAYQAVDRGADQLVSHMWGAPEEVKEDLRLPAVQEVLNMMSAAHLLTDDRFDEEHFEDRLQSDVDRIASRCFDFLERLEEHTDRYTTEQLEDMYEEVKAGGDISYTEPSIEEF